MNRRKQLTLFIEEKYSKNIENIRWLYNIEQYKLIKAHVTLCREDELFDLDKVISNLHRLRNTPVQLMISSPERFADGKGVFLPVITKCQSLRKEILSGIIENPGTPNLHITLMHPRNSCCTDEIFEAISSVEFPNDIMFKKISLIEQVDNNEWYTLDEFSLANT